MIFMQNRILLRNPLNSLLRSTVMISLEFLHLLCPPVWWDIKRWRPSSVRLSVPCLILSREWKDTASRKLTERKHMTLVTRDPIYKLKGQRLMSPGRLILRRKMCRIFRRGDRRTWKLVSGIEYDDPHHRHARWPVTSKFKGQDNKVMSSDTCLPITRERKVTEEAPKSTWNFLRITADCTPISPCLNCLFTCDEQ